VKAVLENIGCLLREPHTMHDRKMRTKCGVFLVVKCSLNCKTFREWGSVNDVGVDCVEGKYRTTSKWL